MQRDGLYLPSKPWVGGRDFRVKLLFGLEVLILDYVILSSLLSLALLFVLVAGMVVAAGLGRELLLRSARFFLVIVAVSVLIQGVFHNGSTVLVRFPDSFGVLAGRPLITLDGVILGVILVLRLFTIALTFLLMIASTPPTRIVQGLVKMGVPFKYATLTTMIFRFYPVMAGEFSDIREAQASRGFEIEKGSLLKRFTNFIPLIIPTLLSALRKSSTIAVALEFRGYSLDTKRSFVYDQPLNGADAVFLSFSAFLLVVPLALRLFFAHPL